MASPKLHIEPMTVEELEALLGERPGKAGLALCASAQAKLRRVLDSQPEQGGETVQCHRCGKTIPRASACYKHDNIDGGRWRCGGRLREVEGCEPAPDLQLQKQCGGSGFVATPPLAPCEERCDGSGHWHEDGAVVPCHGCSHPDCPNRLEQRGGLCLDGLMALVCPECRCGHIFPADANITNAICNHGDPDRQIPMQLVPVVPATASPKPLLERLAGELEEKAGSGLSDDRLVSAHGAYSSIAQRLREEAEGLEEAGGAQAAPAKQPDRDVLAAEIDGLERLANESLGGDPRVQLLASVARFRALTLSPESQDRFQHGKQLPEEGHAPHYEQAMQALLTAARPFTRLPRMPGEGRAEGYYTLQVPGANLLELEKALEQVEGRIGSSDESAEPHLESMYFERFKEAVRERVSPALDTARELAERVNQELGDYPAYSAAEDAIQEAEAALSKAQELMEEGG